MLHSSLFEVQRKALELGHNMPGFAYFLEMGLGKTRVTLFDAYWHLKARRADIAIVLCPRSLRGAWQVEAETIGFPYPVLLMEGTAEQMWKSINALGGPCVVVIHYEITLTRGGDFIELVLAKEKKVFLALDESTRIKNPKAKVGKFLIVIKDQFKYIRILSGYPAPQGPHDLWGQFKFIGATDSSYFQWRNTYCTMGGWMGKQVTGAQNIDILHMRTKNYVFRAKKSDWTDLPEKLWPDPREISMTKEQRQAYLQMMQDFVLEWGDKEISAKMAVTAKTKLQQIGSGFLYDNDGVPVNLFSDNEKNPKIEELLAVIEETEHKLIVFYHFHHSYSMIKTALERQGVKTVDLPSGLNEIDIEHRKALFNQDDDYKVALMQSSSMKYGHTMLGTAAAPCHVSVFFENSYDSETRVQAEDRNHRHGQRNPVTYIDFCTSREDRKVILALQKKTGLQEALMGEFTGKPTWN